MLFCFSKKPIWMGGVSGYRYARGIEETGLHIASRLGAQTAFGFLYTSDLGI